MIRGISKRIIEINDTGSDYFEKALFFVRADNKSNKTDLEREAKKLVYTYMNNETNHCKPGYLRYKESRKKRNALIVGFACIFTFVVGICVYFVL